MKIDYKNYPVLENLEKGKFENMPVIQKDKLFFDVYANDFFKNWKLFQQDFKSEINIISQPFLDACSKSYNKLGCLLEEIMTDDLDDFIVKGTFIVKDTVCMISYDTRKGSDVQELAFYIFDRWGSPLCMNVMSTKHNIDEIMWVTEFDRKRVEEVGGVLAFVKSHLLRVFIYKMFKSYAQVETKILQPKQKVMDIVCKYKNDTKLKLTFLDSKWFTNLVKSDGFNVRGHFRLQPKKANGQWTKELIWISDFQKTGYTAPAKMLSANNQI